MIRVVLDTNIILSAISRKSPHRIVIDKLIEGKYEVLVTTSILSEYDEKLNEIFDNIVAEDFLRNLLLSPNCLKTQIYFSLSLIHKDFDDNKFADCAFAGNANYLVSNDKHLLALKMITFPKINVIALNEFKTILSGL